MGISDRALKAYLRDPLELMKREWVLSNGRRFAEAIEPWQEEVLRELFKLWPDGKPYYRTTFLQWGRGCGKTELLSGYSLARAFSMANSEVVILACDEEQAGFLLRRCKGAVERNPDLATVFELKQKEMVGPRGSRIYTMSSDQGSSWGLGGQGPFFAIADEIWTWANPQLYHSIVSATGKGFASQVTCLSTAGYSGEDSAFNQARDMCMDETNERAFYHELPSLAEWTPGWIDPDWVKEQERILPPLEYERLICNRCVPLSEIAFLTKDVVERCIDPELEERWSADPFVSHYAVSVDAATTRDRAAVCVLHRADDGAVVLDLMHVFYPPIELRAVTDLVEDLCGGRFGYPKLVVDPWEMRAWLQGVRGRFDVREFAFSPATNHRLATNLLTLFRSGGIRLYRHEELIRECLTCNLVERGRGHVRLDHLKRAGFHDDCLVALGMAALEAVAEPAPMSLEDWERFAEEQGEGLILPGFEDMEDGAQAVYDFWA